MPDGTNNIYIDSTFTSTGDGYTSVDSNVEFVSPDNIGNYNIPVIYQTTTSAIAMVKSDVEYLANYVTVSGSDNILLSFFRELSSDFGVVPSLVEYSVDSVISGTLNNYIAYLTGYSAISGTIDEKITYIAGEHYTSFKNYLVEHSCGSVISGSNSYWQDYMNFSGNVSIEGDPIPSFDQTDNSIVEYESNEVNSGGVTSNVDITFAGWVSFLFSVDMYSVDAGVTDTYPLDVLTISGGLVPHYLDVYSTILTTSGIDLDVYCSLLDMEIINVDVEMTTGRMWYIDCDLYSVAIKNPAISCDIDLYPIKITNFSLDIGEYSTALGHISVDVLDDIYGITTSGTYFKVDNEIVPVTFSGIEDGYRMFYDPDDDFSSLNGPTIFTARAENSNGDILEKDFYLTFGYIVEYSHTVFDYNTRVTVRVTAENYESCPKMTSDGHRFITEHRETSDLGASIIGMFHADDVSDLTASIYPESTAYFYGKTFEVVIEAKDFAENTMDPFILSYKIEDKPN